ncbi:MAG: DUF393 domain-containing protein [Deltaproteobacteria bacterium]|nr:DUF393 domain-containing protein [Deltaproteobacteria bacterium]
MTRPFTIFYDGSCGLCRKEMAQLKAKDTQEKLELVDAMAPNFDAATQDLEPTKLRQMIHLKDAQGNLYVGVDAFAIIWRVTGHPWLAYWCRMPLTKPIAKIIYRFVAKYRYKFSKITCGKDECEWKGA